MSEQPVNPASTTGRLTAVQRRVRWHYRRRVLRHPLLWWRERCARCGRRRYPHESMILAPGSGKFHDTCHLAWRLGMVAEERLRVLDVVTDVWEVNSGTVQELMALRAKAELSDEANARNAGWRVFYDLDNRRKAAGNDEVRHG